MNIDFACWWKRWSTWLAALSLSAGGALAAYAIFPQRLQELMPDWLLVTLGGIAMGAAFLIPLATSVQQKNLPPPNAGKPPAP